MKKGYRLSALTLEIRTESGPEVGSAPPLGGGFFLASKGGLRRHRRVPSMFFTFQDPKKPFWQFRALGVSDVRLIGF